MGSEERMYTAVVFNSSALELNHDALMQLAAPSGIPLLTILGKY